MDTFFSGKNMAGIKALPDDLWHALQWQFPVKSGSASVE
jgi:hypothetical protein